MPLIKVTYFQRKAILGHWSLEFIFNSVRKLLSQDIVATVKIATYISTGFFKRLYNTIEAVFCQGDVNHITGDIHYITLFLKKKKTVLTILDCVFMNNKSGIKKKVLQFFWLTMPSKRVTYITAISEFTKQQILSYLPGYPPDKIIVVPVAVSEAFTPAPKTFNSICPTILHLGLAPNKNLERLIESLEGISCKLVVIGKLNDGHKEMLGKYGISYESYYGLEEKAVVAHYQQSDILSFVSTYEGFGMPIIEANKTGRVVVTSNCASMPEVAGNAACLVDPFDVSDIRQGILKIISDEGYRNELIINGYKNAERFDGARIASKYLDIYKLINNKN